MEQDKDLQKSVSGEEDGEQDNNSYIEAIKEMKKNTVPRADYEKVQAENKKLLETLIDGGQAKVVDAEEKVDADALRKELYFSDKPMSNLEYVEKTLKLRKAQMEQGYQDPFLPTGTLVPLTQDDYNGAEKVAAILEECVEIADGDPHAFNMEFQRRLADTPTLARNKRR